MYFMMMLERKEIWRPGVVFVGLVLLIGAVIVGCGKSNEPETITNRVYLPEKIEIDAGETFTVPVNFDNGVSLSAINVPLLVPASILRLDSVSFRDSRTNQFMFREVYAKADTLVIGAVDDTAAVQPGRGLLATIYFLARPDAPDTTFVLNTFDYPRLPFIFYDLQLDSVLTPPRFRACSVHIKGQSSGDGGSGRPN